jgi:hypothetical protein
LLPDHHLPTGIFAATTEYLNPKLQAPKIKQITNPKSQSSRRSYIAMAEMADQNLRRATTVWFF